MAASLDSVRVLNQVLTSGGKHNPTMEIFGGFLANTENSEVSKAFRAANLKAMDATVAKLAKPTILHPVQENEDAENVNYVAHSQQLQTEVGALNDALANQGLGVLPPRPSLQPHQRAGLQFYIEKLRQLYTSPAVQNDPAFFKRASGFFENLKGQQESLQAFLALPPPNAAGWTFEERTVRDVEQQQRVDTLNNTAKTFITHESLAIRFRAAVGNNASNRLASVDQSQRNEAAVSAGVQAEYSRLSRVHAHSFLPARFESIEQVLMSAKLEQDLALKTLWEQLLPGLPAGVPHWQTAEEIRIWMNDPANHDAEGLLTMHLGEFTFRGLTVVPPEIARLPLNVLTIEAPRGAFITSLPEEMATMPYLKFLSLTRTQFQEFPSVLARMPGLLGAVFLESQNTFTSIPEEAWEHLAGGWVHNSALHVLKGLQSFFLCVPDPSTAALEDLVKTRFGRSWNELTDVPFALWFQEYCTLPSHFILAAPLGISVLLPTFLLVLADAILPEILSRPIMLVLIGLGLVSTVVSALATLAINIPFILGNLFIMKALFPIVQMIRDQLGYDRMVHLRDAPVAPPAAP
jgi:hypothetical protein